MSVLDEIAAAREEQLAEQGALAIFGGPSGVSRGRAGFLIRLCATLIDAVIVVVVMVPGDGLLFLALRGRMDAGSINYLSQWLIGSVLLVYLASEVYLAATPGKLLLKLRIANADGSPATTARLLKRFLYKQSQQVLLFMAAVTGSDVLGWTGSFAGLAVFAGCFFALRPSRLAAHDVFAGTAVYGRWRKTAERGFEPVFGDRDSGVTITSVT